MYHKTLTTGVLMLLFISLLVVFAVPYVLLVAVFGAGAQTPSSQPADGPRTSLDYWLQRAGPATTTAPADCQPGPQTDVGGPCSGPADASDAPEVVSRQDALPGVVELSDGRLLAGEVFTTRGRLLEVYVEKDKLWRRVPLEACLSICAVVEEESIELQWRWKAMGEPERTYTGQSYPTRRLSWRLRLIDGSEIVGAIKGQPLWVDQAGGRSGPFILHERSKGEFGQSLEQLLYVKRVIISRRAMEEALKQAAGQ